MFNVPQCTFLAVDKPSLHQTTNQISRLKAMSSGIGSTLTGGIQDIAGILPLLGTEQCSIHVSSALTRGYLYAASAPMSIFGSLGVVSAGFQTLVACFSFGGIEGAKILGNMGFEPQGENLSLIMVEGGKGENKGRYIIENRIDELGLIDELNIDNNRIIGIFHKSAAWNVKMMATTALLCAFSIAPYIYINLVANTLNLKKGTIWVFPILRSTGGFLTATLIQLLIQQRITTISDRYLKRGQLREGNGDVEAAVEENYQMDAGTWPLLCLLLIGLLASVVGYVGCFSIVQNSVSTSGPFSWLCLEIGLSVIRLAIWAWNPTRDDAPPLEIKLELDKYEHNPLPTCNKDNAEILDYKVLPLTRARDFLKIITSFAGLIKPFRNPDLSLYYTLTWNRPSRNCVLRRNGDIEPDNAEKHELGERTLYITVLDHKEHTTRVYTRDNEIDTFYSTKSDAPLYDVGHFLLEVEIGAPIDPRDDPVSSDWCILLREHHKSILEHIQYRADITKTYAIYTSWTMKVENTTLQRLRTENSDVWEEAVEKGKEEKRTEDLVASDYFMHSSIERERQLLDAIRVKWIGRRMDMITKETKERFQGEMGAEYRVNKRAVEKNLKPATKSLKEIEEMLGREQYCMELLLVCEVRRWEQLFLNKFQAFLDQIDDDRVKEKERLRKEWRADCWKRLNPQMDAAMKRMADVGYMESKDLFLESLDELWALSISQLFEGGNCGNPDISLLSDLKESIADDDEEIRLRMEREIEDTEFRLKRGSELGRFDQFWDDDTLFQCRYSRSKWLGLRKRSTTPLEIYSQALKGNKNIVHITFGDMDSDFDVNQFLCDLPWVTSITPDPSVAIPNIHPDLLFIESNDLNTFAKLDPSSTYIFLDAGISDLSSGKLGSNGRVLISFVPPTSGESLILRVKHSGEEDASLEVTLGSSKIQLNPSSKSSLEIDDITLCSSQFPDHPESDYLLFEPKVRNNIYIWFIEPDKYRRHRDVHYLHDIELLDEADLEYMPHSASLSNSTV